MRERVAVAAAAVRSASPLAPEVAVVTGSGLADLAARVEAASTIPYDEIPGWPASTVPGHPGELVLGLLGGKPVAFAKGRSHLYEGHPAPEVAFGVRVLAALGARTMVMTNAAGGLNPSMTPGDVMALSDHLFLPGICGASPLCGADADVGPRFPAMLGAYDPELRRAFRASAVACGLTVHEGVYAMVAGPSFETPAEARMLRAWGADAVERLMASGVLGV
jgi:purine-nucleoside phosphorylase